MPFPPPTTVYSVAEFTRLLQGLLEKSFSRVWVEGEVSSFVPHSSGHWYFDLKEDDCLIKAVMFRSANASVQPVPKNGDLVRVRARMGYYAPAGRAQLVCETLEQAGFGRLLVAYEALKARLAAEGLFDAARKRPLPRLPRRIGLITSDQGAAVKDVLTTLERRFPLAPVIFSPVPVQGAAAVPAIVQALTLLPRSAPVDVILLVRGGGSIEDLWAFNEEAVARAILACPVPVVTGIGHETDTTIADLVADLRAATPTAAAEHITPDRAELLARLARTQSWMRQRLEELRRARLDAHQRLARRLAAQTPDRLLEQLIQRLDEWDLRAQHALGQRLTQAKAALERYSKAQLHGALELRISPKVQQRRDLATRLAAVIRHALKAADMRLSALASRLRAAAPQTRLHHRTERLEGLRARFLAAQAARLEGLSARQRLLGTRLGVQAPTAKLRAEAVRLEGLTRRLSNRRTAHLPPAERQLHLLQHRLMVQLRGLRQQADPAPLAALGRRLQRAGERLLAQAEDRVKRGGAQLEAHSPRRVLERGYAVVRDVQGHVLTDPAEARRHAVLEVRLAKGALHAQPLPTAPKA